MQKVKPNPHRLTNVKQWRVGEDGKLRVKRLRKYLDGVYDGEFIDGKRDGEGTLTKNDGTTYKGFFENGTFNGKGILQWESFQINGKLANGKKYEGGFKYGKMHGEGKLFDGFGNVWEGNWQDGNFTGKGTLRKHNGEYQEGLWLKGKLHCDDAIINFHNGDKYKGPVVLGKMCGKSGYYEYSNGSGFYTGNFYQGLMHGSGKRCFMNKSTYSGDYVDGINSGYGIMEFKNHDTFENYKGQWNNGQPHGKGELVFTKRKHGKAFFKGDFYKGVIHGCGKLIYQGQNNFYDGDFKACSNTKKLSSELSYQLLDGKRNGRGTRQWSSGNRFEGSWHNDDMMYGTYTNVGNNSIFVGGFENNKKSGHGKETWRSLNSESYRDPVLRWKHDVEGICIYKGEYKNDFFHGKGSFLAPDGRSFEGDWKKGKQHGHGVAVLLGRHELGNYQRMSIGKYGSLYRALKYIGEWENGVRHGKGKLVYLDGSEKEGQFVRGQLDGTIIARYFRNEEKK